MMGEIWKDIPGYEGLYRASSEGRIVSLAHVVEVRRFNYIKPIVRHYKQKFIKPARCHKYCVCILTNAAGVQKRWLWHRVIALTFIGPPPAGVSAKRAPVCHYDGDGYNNRASNLRYATVSENHADKIRHGTDQFGERNSRAKLTVEKVHWIHEHQDILSKKTLARIFRVSPSTVHLVLTGKNWPGVALSRALQRRDPVTGGQPE